MIQKKGTTTSTDSNSMNTGSGLAISKTIMDLMHGNFRMEFDSGMVCTKIELPIENISCDAYEDKEEENESPEIDGVVDVSEIPACGGGGSTDSVDEDGPGEPSASVASCDADGAYKSRS